MNSTTKFLRLITLVVVLLSGVFTPSIAFADETKQEALDTTINKVIKVDSGGKIECTSARVKNLITTSAPTNAEYYSAQIGTSGVTIYWLKSDDTKLAGALSNVANSSAASDKVGELTDTLVISADTSGAATLLSGVAPIINLFLGIIATLITFGMSIFSAFDICYIAFPVFRGKCDNAKESGKTIVAKLISDDAEYAVKEGTVDSGKNPWGIYFGKRVGSYIFLAIIMFMLITGNISLITSIALKVVSGIMEVLAGLAG